MLFALDSIMLVTCLSNGRLDTDIVISYFYSLSNTTIINLDNNKNTPSRFVGLR